VEVFPEPNGSLEANGSAPPNPASASLTGGVTALGRGFLVDEVEPAIPNGSALKAKVSAAPFGRGKAGRGGGFFFMLGLSTGAEEENGSNPNGSVYKRKVSVELSAGHTYM